MFFKLAILLVTMFSLSCDIVQAQDNAKIGPVVSVDSATTMTVNGVEEALANTDTINWKYPLEFVFGFEY